MKPLKCPFYWIGYIEKITDEQLTWQIFGLRMELKTNLH